MNWLKDLKGSLHLGEPLRMQTTFRIGAPARYFVEPKDIDDLKLLLNASKRYKIPILVLGAGSNILAGDSKINKIVLKLNAPVFKSISLRNNHLAAGSGAELSRLIRLTLRRGLSGLEFLAGIPGSLGGALAMNAGAWGRSIAELVESVSVMDYHGRVKTLKREDLEFGYRSANPGKFIILGASLKLKRKNRGQIRSRIEECLKLRRETQDLSKASAGCVFKNPRGKSAGRLIDECGLKGKRIGGAVISRKHANFILNTGNAKARDVLRLMALAKRAVKKKFDITLEPEIKIWK